MTDLDPVTARLDDLGIEPILLPVFFCLGYALQRWLIAPMSGGSEQNVLLVTLALALVARRRGATLVAAAAGGLLAIELAQGLLGFVQYFTDLPEVLVGLHMLGAALISAAVTAALLSTRSSGGGRLPSGVTR